jgi:AcrR family transcriptional regulator
MWRTIAQILGCVLTGSFSLMAGIRVDNPRLARARGWAATATAAALPPQWGDRLVDRRGQAGRVGPTSATGQLSDERPMRCHVQRNYERLVLAAREVLRESGTESSLEEIARRAGVGIGTLYRRFPTRLSLLEAVYREDVDALGDNTARLVEKEQPWEALEAWVWVLLDYVATKRALFQELVDSVGRDSELLTHSREAVVGAAGLVLRNAQEAGVARAGVEPSDLLRLVGGCTMMGELEPAQQQRVIAIVLGGIRSTA